MSEKIKFNDNQLLAIKERNNNILLSAAAGSGKTAVLVERIIRLILEEHIDIDKILVVTFTNAAASGMKTKIKEALKAKIKEDKNNNFLKRQFLLLESANISTVHSFCLKLIKKYSYMLPEEVPTTGALINDTEKELTMYNIIDEILSEYYEKDDILFNNLSLSFGGGRNDRTLIEIIFSIYNNLVSIPNYKKWIDNALETLFDTDNFYESKSAEFLYNYIKNILKSSILKYDFVINYMEQCEGFANYITLFSAERDMFKNVFDKDNLSDILSSLNEIVFDSLNSHRATKGTDTTIPKAARDLVKKEIDNLKEDFSLDIINLCLNNKENFDIIKLLFDIVKEFDKRFKEAKYSEGLIDFNDIEHLTIDILSDSHGNLKEELYPLRDGIKEILVDEYQDTNDVQSTIFNLLKKDNNLFTVGDVKQSIYRFRHSNPDIFLKGIKDYEKYNKGKVINLNANYRCSKNIIEMINYIFAFNMTKDISDIDYLDNNELVLGGDFIGDKAFKTEILISHQSEDKLYNKREIEAFSVAQKIKEIVNNPDLKINGKCLQYSDIVILIRNFSEEGLSFVKSISGYGIPINFANKESFLETAEVKNIISYLRIIDNPNDDISLISVLRNILNYKDDRLLEIRNLDRENSFFEALLKSEDEKDKKFIINLREYKKFSLRYPIHILIEKIYRETNFDIKELSSFGGLKKKENLDNLLDISKDYEETGLKGISSFILYVDKIMENKKKIETPMSTEEKDTVTAMTIHKSKGLEFPVCFLCNMDKPCNIADNIHNVIINSELGIGYTAVNYDKQYKYKTISRRIIELKEKKESLLEEMRVLYVALTRAKYKLIMSGAMTKLNLDKYETFLLSEKNEITYIDFMKINSYFDFVLPSLLKSRNFKEYKELSFVKDLKLPVPDFSLNIINDYDLTEYEKEKEEKAKGTENNGEDFDLKDKEYFDNLLNFKYVSNLKDIPKKISVSSLKGIYDSEDTDNTKKIEKVSIYAPEFKKEAKITNRERGILVHSVFEGLDLNELKNKDAEEVILTYLNNKTYLKDKLTLYDVNKIASFFKNPLGIKMLRAKKVYREKDFLMRMKVKDVYNIESDEEIIIQGIIDCFFIDTKDKIYLIDYKYVNKSAEEMKETYKFQIDLYKKALCKIGFDEKDIISYIWDINKEKAIKF